MKASRTPFSLTIVLPARNEEASIERVVRSALAEGERVADRIEVVPVDDGSTDATGSIIDRVAAGDQRVRPLHHPDPAGYGRALRSGFAAATGDWIFYSDGDGQFDLSQLDHALAALRSCDVVAGRRAPRRDPWRRRAGGWAWTRITNAVFGLSVQDVDCAFKMFPRSLVSGTDLASSGALISAELLYRAKAAGLRIDQIPVRHLPRTGGRATGASPRVVARALRELLTLSGRIKRQARRGSMKVDGGAARLPVERDLDRARSEDARARTKTPPRETVRTGRAALAVFAVAFLLYVPSIGYGFTGWDDTAYTVNNPHVTSSGGFRAIWTSPDSDQYYPLTFTSFWLEDRLWDGGPAGYHAVNALLHALDSVLVLLVLRSLGSTGPGSGFGALLFAVHPVQAMTVAWIAERKNLLACAFTLLTVLAWIRLPRSGALVLLASLCFAAALASKTAVLGLPLVLVALDVMVLRRPWRRSLACAAPMAILSVVSALVTAAFEKQFIDQTAADQFPGLGARIQIAGAAPWFYLAKLVLPIGLSPVYRPWSPGPTKLQWWIPLGATLGVFALGTAALIRGRSIERRMTAWFAVFFIVFLGPSLGLIPFGNLAVSDVSDHFLYIPMVGAAGIAAMAIDRLMHWHAGDRAWAIQTAAGLVVALLGAATIAYAPVFRDPTSLWSRVLEADPDSYVGHLGMAEVARAEGRQDEALGHYERAIAARPAVVDAYLFLGEHRKQAGDAEGAARAFEQALAHSPGSIEAMVGLASALERSGHPRTALELYQRAVRLAPRSVPARMGLGGIDIGFARMADALVQFEAVIALRPDYARGYLGSATCLRSLSRWAEAAEVLRRGLARSPEDIGLLNMLALTLATSPDPSVRNGAEAVRMAEHAVAAAASTSASTPATSSAVLGASSASRRSDLLETLAAAYEEAGRPEDAARARRAAEGLQRQQHPGEAISTR